MAVRLCVDAGHGMGNKGRGYDPGAVGFRAEADLALEWALTLQHVCRESGVEVFLTRRDAVSPCPLGSRVQRALSAGCTHFLSVHFNCCGGSGCEAYYSTLRQASFARSMLDCVVGATGFPERGGGVKHESLSALGRLAVLSFPMACLIEPAFVTDRKAVEVCSSRDTRVAWAVRVVQWAKSLR